MNISSIRNIKNDLKILISDSVDILYIAESKLDERFLNSEIVLNGFKKRYQLDVTVSRGGLLIYVKASLPSKIINHYEFPKDIQCIAMDLNVTNKKYVIFSIYRPPKQNVNYFLNSVSEGIDFYSKHYENICILGDFSARPSNSRLTLFLENQNLKSMIKNLMF